MAGRPSFLLIAEEQSRWPNCPFAFFEDTWSGNSVPSGDVFFVAEKNFICSLEDKGVVVVVFNSFKAFLGIESLTVFGMEATTVTGRLRSCLSKPLSHPLLIPIFLILKCSVPLPKLFSV